MKKLNIKIKLNKKTLIIGIAVCVLVIALVIGICVGLLSRDKNPSGYEPAHPDAPRLSSLGAIGEKIDFSKEDRYYEVFLPEGNPNAPMVWATAISGIELEIFQAYFADGQSEASAKIYLDDGKYTNSYEIKFIRRASKGLVLQYDDRYKFTPNHQPQNGEEFTFVAESPDSNITVDNAGVIRAVGVSDRASNVCAYIGDAIVDIIEITKTTKANLNVFIVAGQGNASGEGGNIEESVKIEAGKAYTAELDDDEFGMTDLAEGRNGFSPAFAQKWCAQTGEKALFIQTAVPNVSVTKWTTKGEAYIAAKERVTYYLDKLKKDDSFYTVNKVFCIWFHGEWDIYMGMSAEEYTVHLTEFYNNMKELSGFDMMALVPVRLPQNTDGSASTFKGVNVAQYMMSNNNDDIRIITRIPETASIENGLISSGNLYYSQEGYNKLGEDCAYNLYNCYSWEADRNSRLIEMYVDNWDNKIEYGKGFEIVGSEEKTLIAVVSPLYAKNKKISLEYDETAVDISKAGIIKKSKQNETNQEGEILLSCGGVDLRFVVKFSEEIVVLPTQKKTYVWNFDDLTEENGKNNLKVSDRTTEETYTFGDGVITLSGRNVDFAFEKKVVLDSYKNWSIEWMGYTVDNSILLGGEYSTKGYIFLAPYINNAGYVKFVDDDDNKFYIFYEDYAEENRKINTWKLSYSKDKKTVTLYADGDLVSSVVIEDEFKFSFTNLFGRYGSDKVNYCYVGKIDTFKISFEE